MDRQPLYPEARGTPARRADVHGFHLSAEGGGDDRRLDPERVAGARVATGAGRSGEPGRRQSARVPHGRHVRRSSTGTACSRRRSSGPGTPSSNRSIRAEGDRTRDRPPTIAIDDCLSVRDGHLWIEGCDTVELARRFGTPVHVVSEDQLRRNVRRIGAAFTAPGLRATFGSCRRSRPTSRWRSGGSSPKREPGATRSVPASWRRRCGAVFRRR